MPCFNPKQDAHDAKMKRREKGMLRAALCGILRADPTILDRVDWDQVGVGRKKVERWWKAHQEQDRQRTIKEAVRKADTNARDAALAKLTKEDRKALGL